MRRSAVSASGLRDGSVCHISLIKSRRGSGVSSGKKGLRPMPKAMRSDALSILWNSGPSKGTAPESNSLMTTASEYTSDLTLNAAAAANGDEDESLLERCRRGGGGVSAGSEDRPDSSWCVQRPKFDDVEALPPPPLLYGGLRDDGRVFAWAGLGLGLGLGLGFGSGPRSGLTAGFALGCACATGLGLGLGLGPRPASAVGFGLRRS
mmetsp:Transcript_30480/g.97260  ORF Transcript_30480/g.97260 Transcript_30480/m.97260 type:complete len:207 (+) Transcript_30480:211-831(+)